MCYRIAIGRFYNKAYGLSMKKEFFSIKNVFSSLLNDYKLYARKLRNILPILRILCLQSYFDNNMYTVILLMLLLMCMDVESDPGPTINELSIFHLNIRSVRNKLDYIEDIASDYNIISLTETHLDENIPSRDLELQGFSEPYRADRNFAGGGILVYVSEQIKTTRRFDLEFPNGELIWLQLDFPHSFMLLCTVYRPPNATNLFWEQFRASIESAMDLSSNIVIVGDMNVDLLTVTRHHVFSDIMANFDLRNVINAPTRIGNTRASLLDPLFFQNQLSTLNQLFYLLIEMLVIMKHA